MAGNQLTFFLSYFQNGDNISKIFSHNQNINTELFGADKDGYCMHGLFTLSLYFHVSAQPVNNSFMFTYNGTNL